MKTGTKLGLFIIAGFTSLLFSCTKKDNYPDTPYIEYMSLTKIRDAACPTCADDKGTLKISFTDGNGDIGLEDGDTLPPYDSAYYYNFFIRYFEKINGVFREVELPISNNARIPLLSPLGEDKPLKGEIEIELYINNYFSTHDTIRYEAYLVDRALNKSNTITTPEIIIKK